MFYNFHCQFRRVQFRTLWVELNEYKVDTEAKVDISQYYLKRFCWKPKRYILGGFFWTSFEIFNFIYFFSLEWSGKEFGMCRFFSFAWYWCWRLGKYFVNVVFSISSFFFFFFLSNLLEFLPPFPFSLCSWKGLHFQ